MEEMTWTEHTNVCSGCGRRFRISAEAIAQTMLDDLRTFGPSEKADLAEIINRIEWCLECVAGEPVDGEIVEADAWTFTL